MSDLEMLIVGAVVGAALATVGALAAANFKDIAGSYTRSMVANFRQGSSGIRT